MFNIVLDEEGYWTGLACKNGKFEGGIDVNSLPTETDLLKQKAYKYSNNNWFFDGAQYQKLLKSDEILKQNANNSEEYFLNKIKLNKLSEDIVQSFSGISVPNLNSKKREFAELLNKVRAYEGKEPKLVSENLYNNIAEREIKYEC